MTYLIQRYKCTIIYSAICQICFYCHHPRHRYMCPVHYCYCDNLAVRLWLCTELNHVTLFKPFCCNFLRQTHQTLLLWCFIRNTKHCSFSRVHNSLTDNVQNLFGYCPSCFFFISAYRTFVGVLVLDLAINNSVMHVFCNLLLERRKLCSESSSDSESEHGKYHPFQEGTSSPVSG